MQLWNLINHGDKTIWLVIPGQDPVSTMLSDLEDNIIWINLPRENGQIVVLEQGQELEIGFAHADGFYCAQTTVLQIGNTHGKVYGLKIPEEFRREQRRAQVRSKYSTKALFITSPGDQRISTEVYNFSAGGLRVFATPEFANLLEQEQTFQVMFQIENFAFSLPVRLVWLKTIDEIQNAGFQFIKISEKDQDKLMSLAIKYSKLR